MRDLIQLLENKSKPQDIEIIALNFEPKDVSPVLSKDTLDLHYGKLAHGYDDEYFAFDVQPDTTKQELKAYVDTKLSKVYGGSNSNTGLYAIWTGQA